MSTTLKQLDNGTWLQIERPAAGPWKKADLFGRPLIVCDCCNLTRPEWLNESELSGDHSTPCCEELS
jgi:hypothetical protein